MSLLTTDEMISAVRNGIDEDQTSDITDSDILIELNLAQDYAYNIISRKCPEPLITFTDITVTTAGQIDIPAGIFEEKFLHIDLMTNNYSSRLECIPYGEFWKYDTMGTASTLYPKAWTIVNKTIRLLPSASAGTVVRVWHMRSLDKLVKSEGRITRLGSTYVILDSYAGNLSTSSDNLTSFFNIVGFNSGDIKGTLQVYNVVGNKISFRSTPTRDEVLDHDVVSSLDDCSPAVRVDDFICAASGTCIPYFPKPLSNYIIQAAIVSTKDRLGYDPASSRATLGSYEAQLTSVWSGRPSNTKIIQKSRIWKR